MEGRKYRASISGSKHVPTPAERRLLGQKTGEGARPSPAPRSRAERKPLHLRKHAYSFLLLKIGKKDFSLPSSPKDKETKHFLKEGLFSLEVIRRCLGEDKGENTHVITSHVIQ